MTKAEAFAWYMPGEPPVEGCWDWTGSTRNGGYGQFGMADGTVLSAHVAAYEIYHGPTGGLCVLHDCDRPVCVQPVHLHLGTRGVNAEERDSRSRQAVGVQVGSAKLTEADVLEIRASDLSQHTLAKMYGVTQGAISAIHLGKTWKHLSPTLAGRRIEQTAD